MILCIKNNLTNLPASPITLAVLARVAVRDHGYKGVEVAEALSVSPSTVSRIVECGENILDNQKDIGVKIVCMEI